MGRDATESGDVDGYVSCADSTDGAGGGGIEERVHPTALLVLLRKEIEAAGNDAKTPYIRGPHACFICPIRIFNLRSRLRAQIEKDHDEPNGAGRPSSRAMRLIIALFRRDQILTASGLLLGVNAERAPYLQQSRSIVAAWMSQCVNFYGEFASGEITQIDRHGRLCLTRDGPKYFIKGKEALSPYRISGYTYYTAEFAALLYSVAIKPETKSKLRTIMDSAMSICIASGCESCFLLPSRPVVYLHILEDIVNFHKRKADTGPMYATP